MGDPLEPRAKAVKDGVDLIQYRIEEEVCGICTEGSLFSRRHFLCGGAAGCKNTVAGGENPAFVSSDQP